MGERIVRIITAEIINQMSSPEGETAEFDAIWESKLQQIDQEFEKIRESLPPSAVNFYKNVDLAGCHVQARAHNWSTEESMFVIDKFQDKKIFFINYELVDQIEIDIFTGAGFAQDEPAIWLYDEFHRKKSYFEHHVVFSDGLSYVIPFKSFYLRKTSYFEHEA